jgi:Fe-S-cluster containining protein
MTTIDHLELDLEKIKELGKIRERENLIFRAFLKQKDSYKVDKIVHKLNKIISEQIDCTTCGNCCKILPYALLEEDIKRLSKALNISTKEVIEQYTEFDEEEQECFLKETPCAFLKDNKCTIYEARPEACRSYPHLHKKEFTSRLLGVIQNYSICPIVFNVYEELKKAFNFR